jgi:predicted dehydrogenase
MEKTRRDFIKKTAIGAAGAYIGTIGMSAKSYGNINGANDRVRVGVVGFSDRFNNTLFPCFLNHNKELNFDIVALSDLWSYRRNLGVDYIKGKIGHDIKGCRNNEELYATKDLDAVIISSPDFAHASHAIEAVNAKCDVYCEKPFAETMEDNRATLKAVRSSKQILQIGSQRRSGDNYKAAANFIKDGKFGDITMVELSWNVNQPGRWRRPELVAKLKEEDTDWKRFLLNRPYEAFDPRKYLEYRLFWPFSSGMPGQWMSHQIDTVHWFTGLQHPRSVTANGGIYKWNDGRKNWDTTTAVFDYGPTNDMTKGFQVVFTSRMHNGDEKPAEIYYSNGGELNLITNTISPAGGLTAKAAAAMNMQANLLPTLSLSADVPKAVASANTGADPLSSAHMRNFMECVRSRKEPNAPVEAGYYHSIANIMTNAAVHTGGKATFDEVRQEVVVNGKVFKY